MIDDELVFAEEGLPRSGHEQVWTIIVADDEPNVHDVTELALSEFTFDGRRLRFIHAYSAEEAYQALVAYPDTAILLLDVVMEAEHAGLSLVPRIRNELKNGTVRIVLRTGQPGAAPEAEVVSRYDINDYKEKTELTAAKLFTLMHSCLRAYRDILTIEQNKRGLQSILNASSRIFRFQAVDEFHGEMLNQFTELLGIHGHHQQPALDKERGMLLPGPEILIAAGPIGQMVVTAGSGRFSQQLGLPVHRVLSQETIDRIETCHHHGESGHFESAREYIGIFKARSGQNHLVYINTYQSRSDLDRHHLDLFSRQIGIAIENIQLKAAIEDAQREIIFRVGGVVETRSNETANHVRRVAKISRLLGLAMGMTDREATILEYASPMHDVGKVGIPDAVLNKPGKLNPEEWEIMKTHAAIGYDILKGSEHDILQTAAIIALEHHEKWNGSGYPFGKRQLEISLIGRITAVADVYDALASTRCYKAAWPAERVIQYFQDERGKHFDPTLVDLLFDNLEAIDAIRIALKDD